MQPASHQPKVHVGKVWRLMLADLGLDAVVVLRRADLPSGLLDGDGSRITLDEFYTLCNSFDAEAQSPNLALTLGQIEASEFLDPAFFAAMCAPNMTVAGQRLVGVFSLDVEAMPAAARFTYRCKLRLDLPTTLAATEIVFLVNLLRRATRWRVVPKAVCMPSALQEPSAFEDLFGCGISHCETASFSLDPMRPFLKHANQMWQSFEPDCVASSLIVLSPFKAANATFALNAGLWFRLDRLAMFAPSSRHAAGSETENPPRSSVQISQTTSDRLMSRRTDPAPYELAGVWRWTGFMPNVKLRHN